MRADLQSLYRETLIEQVAIKKQLFSKEPIGEANSRIPYAGMVTIYLSVIGGRS